MTMRSPIICGATELKPGFAEGWYNLSLTYQEISRNEDAIMALGKAIAVQPDYVDAQNSRAMLLMLLGRFEEGFPGYEWRFRLPDCSPRTFPQPRWDGLPFPGRTLLLHAEQGLGDTLQFIRYAQFIKPLGGKVVVECQRPLYRLLSKVEGIDLLVPRGEALPPFDIHAPLLSLPLLTGTTLNNLPAPVPYLAAELAMVAGWAERLADLGPGMRVGLGWQGNPNAPIDKGRSIPLRHLAPLGAVPGVELVCLQKGWPRSDGGIGERPASA